MKAPHTAVVLLLLCAANAAAQPPRRSTSTTRNPPATARRPRRACRSRRGCRILASTLSGHNQKSPGAAVHQPGSEPGIRIQPCGSRSRVRGSGAAGSDLRDGVLGTGARPRPEHQCRMEAADEPKALELVKKAVSTEAQTRRCASARTSTPSLSRYTGKPEDRQKADRAYADAMHAARPTTTRLTTMHGRCTPRR